MKMAFKNESLINRNINLSLYNISFLGNSTVFPSGLNVPLLRSLNDSMFRRLAPAVVVLAAVMAIGVVGNVLVCYIFTAKLRRSSQNFLLLCLGLFDLSSSCIGVPSEIFDMSHYYLHESVIACKATRFLTTFAALASILVLMVIAVDRYRKVCKPLYRQVRMSHARITVGVICIIAAAWSAPALYLYGHRLKPTPIAEEFGCDCSIDDINQYGHQAVVYEGSLFVAFVLWTLALVLIYVRIWKETKRHDTYLKTHAIFGSRLLNEPVLAEKDESSCEDIPGDVSQPQSGKSSVDRMLFSKYSPKTLRRSGTGTDTNNTFGSQINPVFNEVPDDNESCTESDIVLQIDNALNGEEVGCSDEKNCEVSFLREQMISSEIPTSFLPKRDSPPPALGLCDSELTVKEDCDELEELVILEGFDNFCSSSDDEYLQCCDPAMSEESSATSQLCSFQTAQFEHDQETPTLCHGQGNSASDYIHYGFIAPDDHLPETNINTALYKEPKSNKLFNSTNQLTFSCSSCIDIHNSPTSEDDPCTVLQLSASSADLYSKVTEIEFNNIDSDGMRYRAWSIDSIRMPTDTSSLNVTKTRKQTHSPQIDNKSIKNNGNLKQHFLRSSKSNLSHSQKQANVTLNKANQETQRSRDSCVSFASDLPEFHFITDSPSEYQTERRNKPRKNELIKRKSTQSLVKAKSIRSALKAKRITVIAFVITLGFFLSYLPHLILIILRFVVSDFELQFTSDPALNFYNLLLRSHFANNVVNIFVYGWMHLEFRVQVVKMWKSKPFS